MKMTEGFISLASLKRTEIVFSLSPKYLDNKSPAFIAKNVPFASEAHAQAIYDFPVPGGP
jgi:hypothetical protein